MIFKAFSIYDTKALVYGPPFFMANTGSAVRAFGDLASDPQSAISKHPSDYMLFEIGIYDDAKAAMLAVIPVKNLGLASDFLPSRPGSAPSNVAPEVLK